MCGGLSRADGSSVACQPLALENGASPPAEWFPRAQGSGPRQPGSDGDSRSFRVNLHCKHPRNRYLGASPQKMGSGTKRHLAADVLSILSGRHRARGSPALHGLPAWDFGVHRGAAAPTECRVGCAVGTRCPSTTGECLSHPTTTLAIPHSNEGKLRQTPQRGFPASGGVAPGSVAVSGGCSCAWGVRGWVGAGGCGMC